MKNSKKIIAFLLLCLFCISSLAACTGGTSADPADTTAGDTTPVDDGKWPQIEGTVIYVDSAAEEGGDGSKTAPLRSIPEAQARIREIKSGEGLPEGGITVLLASGEYKVTETISFTAEDSGTEESPVRYVSAKENGATLTGGITLNASDFEPITDEEKTKLIDDAAKEKVLKLDLTKYGLTTESVGKIYPHGNDARVGSYPGGVGVWTSELLINNEKMELSRYPNEASEDRFNASFLKVGDHNDVDIFKLADEYREETSARAALWGTDDIWIVGFLGWNWSSAVLPVQSIDTNEMQVTLGHNNYYGISEDGRLFFFNVFAETDTEGEYYIDRENAILYVYPTEDFDNSSIVLSSFDNYIVNMDGASYITLSGFNITGARADAISLAGDHITVENCKISGIGNNAIRANGSYLTLQNNEICEIGDCAIIMDGGDQNTVTPSGNMIYNNSIHHWNQINHAQEYAVKLNGCGTVVSHNEIYEGPHQAIIWYGPNHIMEYNELYNVCYETDDCGAFYSGRRLDCYGSTIRYNFIHDVGSDGGWAIGIYYDDGLGGQTAYGNVILNVTGHGILTCGRDNTIENNLIIDWGDKPISISARTRTLPNTVYEHARDLAEHVEEMQKNPEWAEAFPGYGDMIPYVEGYDGDYDDPMLSTNPANNVVRNNMFFTTTKGYKRDMEYDYQCSKMGIIENNLKFTDADHIQLPDIENGDCTLAEDSEPYKNGFEKIPLAEIGRVANK